MIKVAMVEPLRHAEGQLGAVDDAGVIEFVEIDRFATADQAKPFSSSTAPSERRLSVKWRPICPVSSRVNDVPTFWASGSVSILSR